MFVRWRKKGLRTKECRTKRIRGAQGKRRMSPNLVGTLFCRCHGGEGGNESARRGGGNRDERKRKGALYVFGRARLTAGNSKDGMMERRACVEIRNLKSSGRCVSRCKDYLTRSPPAYFHALGSPGQVHPEWTGATGGWFRYLTHDDGQGRSSTTPGPEGVNDCDAFACRAFGSGPRDAFMTTP